MPNASSGTSVARRSTPTPDPRLERYVINFGQMELEEAEQWPDLLEIVRELVKPERDQNKRDVRRKYWWRFGGPHRRSTRPSVPLTAASPQHALQTPDLLVVAR